MYVPLAVSIGDGFKFGCGFFLALVLAMLVGFVLLAALFVLTSLFGLNLPISPLVVVAVARVGSARARTACRSRSPC